MLEYRSFKEILTTPVCALCWSRAHPAPGVRRPRPSLKSKVSTMSLHRGWGASPMPTSWLGAVRPVRRSWRGPKKSRSIAGLTFFYLAERLAPKPSLIPADATQRALMIGLSHEICGQMGIGWNRRLQLFAPAYASGSPPPNIALMSSKYGYDEGAAKAAGERIAGSLNA